MLAVEIAREIEKIGLEAQLLAADRWPPAEIGGAIVPFGFATLFDPGADGIDTRRRAQIIGEIDIGRRKADSAAELVADLDTAVDFPRPAEQRGGLARTPGDQMLPDLGRG